MRSCKDEAVGNVLQDAEVKAGIYDVGVSHG